MLEPFVRTGTGKVLLVLGAVFCTALAFWDESVTTRSGSVALLLLMPGFVAIFLVRLAGVAAGDRLGRTEMPWGFRVASWAIGSANAFVFGLVGSIPSLLVLGGLVALDSAAAVTPYRPGGARPKPREKLPSAVVVGAVGLAVVLLLHLLIVSRLAWWPLFDWGAIVLVAMIVLRVALSAGGTATEEDALPPARHRVHDRAERAIADPSRARAEGAVKGFLETGDVGGLTTLAGEFAAAARLPPHARHEVEARVPAAAARPGTSREEDLDAAITILERALDPAQAPKYVTGSGRP
ncbi:MAG TPA: hypothetical protein VI997_11185 [Candidatus Thermoplasmatota archaeon]|nr:hypothetical protein [Candidatus Thermoplasmatota archaeon]